MLKQVYGEESLSLPFTCEWVRHFFRRPTKCRRRRAHWTPAFSAHAINDWESFRTYSLESPIKYSSTRQWTESSRRNCSANFSTRCRKTQLLFQIRSSMIIGGTKAILNALVRWNRQYCWRWLSVHPFYSKRRRVSVLSIWAWNQTTEHQIFVSKLTKTKKNMPSVQNQGNINCVLRKRRNNSLRNSSPLTRLSLHSSMRNILEDFDKEFEK